MEAFPDKICPYCKSKIDIADGFVICSECLMPHHKQCWIENNGCTTFGCDGTVDSPKPVDDVINLDYEDFIGLQDTEYNSFQNKSQINAELPKWNWMAFVFAEYWLVYNRLYKLGIVLYIVNIMLAVININIALLVSIAFRMVIGVTGETIRLSNLNENKSEKSVNTKASITLVIGLASIYAIIVLGLL